MRKGKLYLMGLVGGRQAENGGGFVAEVVVESFQMFNIERRVDFFRWLYFFHQTFSLQENKTPDDDLLFLLDLLGSFLNKCNSLFLRSNIIIFFRLNRGLKIVWWLLD